MVSLGTMPSLDGVEFRNRNVKTNCTTARSSSLRGPSDLTTEDARIPKFPPGFNLWTRLYIFDQLTLGLIIPR